MADLSQSRIHELFQFDADAGVLIWRSRPVGDFATARAWTMWNNRYPGTVGGYVRSDGYRLIWVSGRQWMVHRLIWIYVNGPIPDGLQIDHINGVRDDNRLSNLRLVTSDENQRNRSMSSNNTSGVAGVSWDGRVKKWRARIQIDGQQKDLGYFDTAAETTEARAKACREYGYHPNHGRPASSNSITSEQAAPSASDQRGPQHDQ